MSIKKITHAAVRLRKIGDGEYITIPCHRHGDLGKILQELGHSTSEFERSSIHYGFLDNNGVFYSREDAKKVAIASGQFKDDGNDLYSEDLW